MVVAALATCLLSLAESYGHFLFAGIGIGIAGGAFAAGISYISRFYPPQRRSAALGIFGTSNVGAAVTALLAPLVMAAMGRSEEHTSELQSLMRISYAVFCLKKKTK